MLKKLVCAALSAIIMLIGTLSAGAVSLNDLSDESLDEYCTLINGCSRAALRNYEDNDVIDAVVYCGLDLKSPQMMFYVSMYYFANDVDVEKMISDPKYSTQMVSGFDSYLARKGVTNAEADEFIKKYQPLISKSKLSFPTVGAYTLKAKKSVVEKMLDEGRADFVIAGSGFMLKQGDVNVDGKTDLEDIKAMQAISADLSEVSNADESKFRIYACDLNGDGKIDINDVTALQQTM